MNRKQTFVSYELVLMIGGGELIERFSQSFDSEIYEEDIYGTDWIAIGFKMQELREKYGNDILLVETSIERGIVN